MKNIDTIIFAIYDEKIYKVIARKIHNHIWADIRTKIKGVTDADIWGNIYNPIKENMPNQ